MAKIKINNKRFNKALKNLGDELSRAIVLGSQEGGKELEAAIKTEWPVMTGQSSRQITTETKINKGFVITRVGSDVQTPWAEIIERGRQPNSRFPNLGGITQFLGIRKEFLHRLQAFR